MTTKSSEISSGLLAVAWNGGDMGREWTTDKIVAESWVNNSKTQQAIPVVLLEDAEAIISAKDAEIAESDHIRDRCAHLLAETAVALKGPEKALHRHGWQDLPEVAAKQSAALKLAREALFDMQDSYAAVHGWKDSFVIAATTAIAAIDSLQKGE